MYCYACNFKSENNALLNRHLSKCDKYDEWIKTYIPPKPIKCIFCNLEFVDIKYLNNHLLNCKSRI